MTNKAEIWTPHGPVQSADKERVLTKAIIRAADWMNLTATVVAQVIGVSPATISRMKAGSYAVKQSDKSYELGALMIRVYRSLYGILGGHQVTAQEWLRTYNTALRGVPMELMKTVRGLNDVCNYLDARRSVI